MFSARTDRPLEVAFPRWGVYVLESHHGAAFRMPVTRHPYLKVLFVLEGSGVYRFDGGSRAIARGDVLVVPPRTGHQFVDADGRPLGLIVLCVRPDVFEAAPENILASMTPRVLRRHQALAREVERLLRMLIFEQSTARASCATMMTGLALQALATVARAQASPKPEVSFEPDTPAATRVRSYVRELGQRFTHREKIDNVAERLGMSRRMFTQAFRRTTGKSWLDYLRELRVAHAKELLSKTDRTVLWIAFECGFDDLSGFYRAFRAVEGIPPDAWRKKSGRRSSLE